MTMGMLEHEKEDIALGALASRSQVTLISIGVGATVSELSRSFLVKRMEIEYTIVPSLATDDGTVTGSRPFYIVFMKVSSGSHQDTVAECFDATLENSEIHKQVIWTRPGILQPDLVDDTDNVALRRDPDVVKTSKSFSKGYPLDKDETYRWVLFNSGGSAFTTGAFLGLRIRYWGVQL